MYIMHVLYIIHFITIMYNVCDQMGTISIELNLID